MLLRGVNIALFIHINFVDSGEVDGLVRYSDSPKELTCFLHINNVLAYFLGNNIFVA